MGLAAITIGGQRYRDALHTFARERRGALVVPDGATAERVARDLGLELYRIDLAAVISKYIGETEKNLDRALDAPAASGKALLFDEADALFGRRGEVASRGDRDGELEVAPVLAKVAEIHSLALVASREPKALSADLRREIRAVVRPA